MHFAAQCHPGPKRFVAPENIYHLVERMTGCAVGICGKCSVTSGERACVDGPAFTAASFTPAEYVRDKTGRKMDTSQMRHGELVRRK